MKAQPVTAVANLKNTAMPLQWQQGVTSTRAAKWCTRTCQTQTRMGNRVSSSSVAIASPR